jgi:hypothetical protein
MTDYTPNEDYSVKDGLATSDPEKLILGSDVDSEFDEIQTAIATKYDVADLATQAQAEAGTSNSVLMTPLRVAQYLSGGGTGDAALLVDLLNMNDPNDDRIVFYDNSAETLEWLDIGSGLTLTATTLTIDETVIVHDNLVGFVANEHIDHTSVTITAGVGLSYSVGGTDISASSTIDLDINSLTEETVIDAAADDLAFYDDSAAALRKVPFDSILGTALGDGKWYKSTTTALSDSVEITLAFNTADYDALERGTFSTSTGEYTAGADGARILISAYANCTANENTVLELRIHKEGVEVARTHDVHSEGPGTSIVSPVISTTISLAAGEVARVRAFTGGGASLPATPILAGQTNNGVSIVELG